MLFRSRAALTTQSACWLNNLKKLPSCGNSFEKSMVWFSWIAAHGESEIASGRIEAGSLHARADRSLIASVQSVSGKRQIELPAGAGLRGRRQGLDSAQVSGAHPEQPDAAFQGLFLQALPGLLADRPRILGMNRQGQLAGAQAEIVKAQFHADGLGRIALALQVRRNLLAQAREDLAQGLAVVARVRARRRTLDAPVFNVRLAGREGGELLRVRMVSDEEYEWVRMGVMRAPYEGESLELEFMADPATVAQWWLDEVLLLPQ